MQCLYLSTVKIFDQYDRKENIKSEVSKKSRVSGK